MAIKRCYAFPKSPRLEPRYKMVSYPTTTLVGGKVYSSAEMQLVYSTDPTPADLAVPNRVINS